MPEPKPAPITPTLAEKVSRKIIAPGSCVKCGEHPARIIAVTMREGVFVYQVSWWNGADRRIDSLSECELTPTADTKFLVITNA